MNEIGRLTRDNDRLAAQVETQRAVISDLYTRLARQGDELNRQSRLIKDMKILCDSSDMILTKTEDALQRQRDSTRKARRQRNTYQTWADELACWIGDHESDNETLMAYRQWRGDQP